MPLFALANAGVTLSGVDLSVGGSQLVMGGVAIALLAGKPIGVMCATWLMVRIGWGRLPPGVSWAGICPVGLLAGIGFTMSIFISLLAFHDENLLGAAKLGVIVGSVLAACLGLCWGALQVQRQNLRAWGQNGVQRSARMLRFVQHRDHARRDYERNARGNRSAS